MAHLFFRKKILACLCLTILFLSHPVPGWSADFQKGWNAFNSDDYRTALQEWEPLAEAGNAKAQFLLGAMYYDGQGVLRDYTKAAYWYKLAAEQGVALAEHALGAMFEKGLVSPGTTRKRSNGTGWPLIKNMFWPSMPWV